MVVKTSKGQNLQVEDDEEESYHEEEVHTKDFNLTDTGQALVGFKGRMGVFLEQLSIYKATRLDHEGAVEDEEEYEEVEGKGVMQLHSNFSSSNHDDPFKT